MFYLPEKINFPADLAASLESSLRALGLLERAAKDLSSLWPKLAKEHGVGAPGDGHYSFSRAQAEAYAAYYLPVNALKPALVLEEAWQLGLDLFGDAEARWLDCGAGPGTGLWGLQWWAERRGKKIAYHGAEQSKVFSDLSGRIAGKAGARATFKTVDLHEPRNLLASIQDTRPTHLSFFNSLGEIYPDPGERSETIEKALEAMRALCRKDGSERYLLVIEPGTQAHSRAVSELKDRLAGKGYSVLLPCLDNRPCGALVNPRDWCHEEVNCEFPEWLNALGAAASLKKEAFLFSYALVAVNEGAGPRVQSHAGAWRMVSQRLERKGQVECFFCTESGKNRVRVQRSKSTADNEFFFGIGRGEILSSAEAGEKGDLNRASRVHAARDAIF